MPYADASDSLSVVATSGLTVDGAGRVESWDAAGLGLSFGQTAAANRPAVATDGALAFTAASGSSGHWLSADHAGELDFVSDPSDSTLLVVCNWKLQPFTGTKGVWGTRDIPGIGSAGGWCVGMSNSGSNVRLRCYMGNGGTGSRVVQTVVSTGVHAMTVRSDAAAGEVSIRVDGSTAATLGSWSWDTRGGSSSCVVGAQDASGSQDASVDIYSLAAIPRRLSDAECAEVEAWAEDAFGITLGAA